MSDNSKQKTKKQTPNNAPVSEIVLKPLEQVIHDSMMPYSEFVIMDRALPRVEDGLKPVQRRVLYSMLEVGVTPDKPYRKSARIVGDCMGKYHPHGDRSIYDTMVRMAQPFNMGEVLVDGHGNYGSVDGDGAAAMRYTEARLSPISLELLKDIEKDTVSWSFNFDDTTKEPDMLPGRFPNLLVNGATGIAVGLATNIPTHNLGETIDAVVAYIENKKITLDELMTKLPAPDFSTGGYILSSSELKQMYETGKGKIVLRAKILQEEEGDGKVNLVITEIPYQVNKAAMLQKIAKLKETDDTGLYGNITDIVDESDREGTRAVLRLKKDTNIPKLLTLLYKNSDLQINFNANMVAIAGGKPKLMNLLEIISYYVAYQKEVVFKRTKFDLDVSEKRAHILEGLLIAIQNIDEVIAIIKASKSTNEAKENLMQRFFLTDVQAQAILDMRLSRLTNLEVNKLINELEGLKQLIEKLKRILGSDKLQYNLVKTELLEIKKNYGSPRKSVIYSPEDDDNGDVVQEVINEPMVQEEPVVVIYSAGNTIKLVSQKGYNLATKELTSSSTTHEVPTISVPMLNTKTVYLFTNLGNCHTVPAYEIPSVKFKDKGELLSRLIKNYEINEKVIAMFDGSACESGELIMATKQGYLKISKFSDYVTSKQTIAAMKLAQDDELISVEMNQPNMLMSVFTRMGIAIAFEKTDVTTIGRMAQGVKAITLNDGDEVVNAHQVTAGTPFALFLSNGNAKAIQFGEVPLITRARKGSRVLGLTDKTVTLVRAFVLNKNISFVAKSTNGELTFVLNKKMPLGNKDSDGKNILTTKNKANKCEEVFEYVTL